MTAVSYQNTLRANARGLFHAFTRPIFLEVLNPLEKRALKRSEVWQGEGLPAGRGRPVLLFPGFLSGEGSMERMRQWLVRAGFDAQIAPLGRNAGSSPDMAALVARCLEETHLRSGHRVLMIGHSRGGQLARVVTARNTEHVSGLITLGSPLRELLPAHLVVRLPVEGLKIFGDLAGMNTDETAFLRDLRAPLPESLPFAAIWSPLDGVVNGRDCRDAQADNIRVRSTHVGMLWNPRVYNEIATSLSEWERR